MGNHSFMAYGFCIRISYYVCYYSRDITFDQNFCGWSSYNARIFLLILHTAVLIIIIIIIGSVRFLKKIQKNIIIRINISGYSFRDEFSLK